MGARLFSWTLILGYWVCGLSAWGQCSGLLSCEKLCGPPQDVGEQAYQKCLANCEAQCQTKSCTGPAPIGPCVTYTCGSNGQWQVGSVHSGVACTIAGQSGTCNRSGVCVANPVPVSSIDVITYHYDSLRTGWNQNETILTPASLGNSSFGILYTALLDEQVDAQPLLVRQLSISTGSSTSKHDVVYVATENNSVYAIDASSGQVLHQAQIGSAQGPPVPQASIPQGYYGPDNPPFTPCPLPAGSAGATQNTSPCNNYGLAWATCNNNSTSIGINSTPVIDPNTGTLYVMTDNLAGGGPTYYLHALDLATLAEKPGSPVAVSATTTLGNGGVTLYFKAAVQRQRPALLEANGNIYAAFGSFCDYAGDQSRGWLLGWNAVTLQPLNNVQLTNRWSDFQPPAGSCVALQPCFLSSIWMSGFGPAADSQGDIFFVTGNSSGNTSAQGSYQPYVNVPESVVEVASDLSAIKGTFTPYQPGNLDNGDCDFGAGGVLLLPTQNGSAPNLAVAAGKDGNMYLLDSNNLGGLSASSAPASVIGGSSVPATQIVPSSASPPCNNNSHAGPSFYTGSDGVGRVVSSGSATAEVWKVVTSSTAAPGLQLDTSTNLTGSSYDDPGFFTTVSSNGTGAGSIIIWAVQRPVDPSTSYVTLYAIDPTRNNAQIYHHAAGTWPNGASNPNVVPVVANGKVYVASYKQLDIFGFGANSGTMPLTPEGFPRQPNWHALYGTIVKLDGAQISVKLRSGKIQLIDTTKAARRHHTVPLVLGESVGVMGSLDTPTGALQAERTYRVDKSTAAWPADR